MQRSANDKVSVKVRLKGELVSNILVMCLWLGQIRSVHYILCIDTQTRSCRQSHCCGRVLHRDMSRNNRSEMSPESVGHLEPLTWDAQLQTLTVSSHRRPSWHWITHALPLEHSQPLEQSSGCAKKVGKSPSTAGHLADTSSGQGVNSSAQHGRHATHRASTRNSATAFISSLRRSKSWNDNKLWRKCPDGTAFILLYLGNLQMSLLFFPHLITGISQHCTNEEME